MKYIKVLKDKVYLEVYLSQPIFLLLLGKDVNYRNNQVVF